MRFSQANEPKRKYTQVPRDDVRLARGPAGTGTVRSKDSPRLLVNRSGTASRKKRQRNRQWDGSGVSGSFGLTAEQLARELARHQDFRTCVGTHFDYDADSNT